MVARAGSNSARVRTPESSISSARHSPRTSPWNPTSRQALKSSALLMFMLMSVSRARRQARTRLPYWRTREALKWASSWAPVIFFFAVARRCMAAMSVHLVLLVIRGSRTARSLSQEDLVPAARPSKCELPPAVGCKNAKSSSLSTPLPCRSRLMNSSCKAVGSLGIGISRASQPWANWSLSSVPWVAPAALQISAKACPPRNCIRQ
mmetsp:Transcript_11139/g.28249  ORF Transcript_11139/g.28249 Transcript_11139/m.28249 type:complete len:207 (-) Transcript_11139:316-936(-)